MTDFAIEKASLPSVNIENCTARHAVLNATHIKSVCHIYVIWKINRGLIYKQTKSSFFKNS